MTWIGRNHGCLGFQRLFTANRRVTVEQAPASGRPRPGACLMRGLPDSFSLAKVKQ